MTGVPTNCAERSLAILNIASQPFRLSLGIDGKTWRSKSICRELMPRTKVSTDSRMCPLSARSAAAAAAMAGSTVATGGEIGCFDASVTAGGAVVLDTDGG